MLQAAEIVMENFNEEQISFSLAPRLNAIGRLGDANPMVDFLLSDNSVDIAVMVNQLEGMNARRKILCDQVFNGALALIEKDRSLLDQPVLVLDHPEWPAGVVGIVASRLIEMFHRPVILLVSSPGQPLKGSARSIEGIDITAILTQNQKYLLSFGGHPMAAGLSLSADNYLAFKRSLNRTVALQSTTSPLTTDLMIDSWLVPSSFSLNLLKSIDSLSPFGPGNPPLLFASDSMLLIDSTPVGKMKEHLQLQVEDRIGNQTQLIWWHGNGLPLPDGRFDLAYTAHSSNYRGEIKIQFEWVDFRQTVESISIKSRSNKKEIIHFDHRQAIQPVKELEVFQGKPDLIVWSEGTSSLPVSGYDRLNLQPASTLVIWSMPPNIETLRAVVKAVNPDVIHWFITSPLEQELGFYLKSLSKKIKADLQDGQTEIDLRQIAAQLAVSTGIAKLGIEWLACEGNITLVSITDDHAKIAVGGSVDDFRKQSLRQALLQAFNELHSFKSYLKRVEINTLGQQLG
jgi:single-stranded-DNA-specific exonuclease